MERQKIKNVKVREKNSVSSQNRKSRGYTRDGVCAVQRDVQFADFSRGRILLFSIDTLLSIRPLRKGTLCVHVDFDFHFFQKYRTRIWTKYFKFFLSNAFVLYEKIMIYIDRSEKQK